MFGALTNGRFVSLAISASYYYSGKAVNLNAATTLNTRLAESSQALQRFAQNPVVTAGLEDFTQTLQFGNPIIAGLAPEQAYCNYLTLAFRNVAALESENIGVGSVLTNTDQSTFANRATVNNEGGEVSQAEPLLLGITKASLGTQSWISAASLPVAPLALTLSATRPSCTGTA